MTAYTEEENAYVQQLERRIESFEKMNGKQWQELGDQDKVIDRLTKKIARLQDLVVRLADRVT
jgi:capsule polysaccharide export protein KpsE/RkpR